MQRLDFVAVSSTPRPDADSPHSGRQCGPPEVARSFDFFPSQRPAVSSPDAPFGGGFSALRVASTPMDSQESLPGFQAFKLPLPKVPLFNSQSQGDSPGAVLPPAPIATPSQSQFPIFNRSSSRTPLSPNGKTKKRRADAYALDDIRHEVDGIDSSRVALSATPADSAAKGQRKLDKFVTYIPRPSVNPYLHGRHGLPHPAKRQYVPSTVVSRFIQDFREYAVVGRGSFCEVYQCRHRLDGCSYAVKKYLQPLETEAKKQHALNEVFAMSAIVGCRTLVRYYSSWIEDDHLYTQLEICCCSVEQLVNGQSSAVLTQTQSAAASSSASFLGVAASGVCTPVCTPCTPDAAVALTPMHGDPGAPHDVTMRVASEPRARTVLPDALVLRLIADVAEALGELHSRDIVHLDVKPANILLSCEPRYVGPLAIDKEGNVVRLGEPTHEPVSVTFKLADLGLAAHARTPRPQEGDGRYMSRELMNDDFDNLPASDIFALGVSVFELASGVPVSERSADGATTIIVGLRAGRIPALPSMSPDLHALMSAMLDPSPLSRITAAGIRLHPLVAALGTPTATATSLLRRVADLEAELHRERQIRRAAEQSY